MGSAEEIEGGLRRPVSGSLTPFEGERAGTALFAVSVRSTAGVGRTTDTLRYLYAASPLQRLLLFYPEHQAMARLFGYTQPPVWCRSVAEAPNWLKLYHVRSRQRQRLQAVWHRSVAEVPNS